MVSTTGKRTHVQAGDSILWNTESGYLVVAREDGLLRREGENGTSKLDASFLKSTDGFNSFVVALANLIGLKARPVSDAHFPTFKFFE